MKSLNYIRWICTEFFFTVSIFSAVLFGAYAAQIQNTNHLDTTQLTILSGTFFAVFAFSQLISGFLINKFSTKILLGGSALLAGAGALLFSHTDSFLLLIIARIILGLGLGCTFVGVLYIVQSGFPEEKFAFFSSLSQSIANIAAGSMTLFGSKLLSQFAYSLVFTVLGGFLIISSLLLIIVLPGKPKLDHNQVQETSFITNIKSILSKKGFWLATVYFSGIFGTILTFADLFDVKYQVAVFDMPQYKAITLSGMIPLGLAIGGVTAGFISSKFKTNKLTAIVFSFITLANMLVLLYVKFPANGNYGFNDALIFHILFGVGCGGAMLAFQELQMTFSDASIRPLANSMVLTIAYLFSGMLLQPLVGKLVGNNAVVPHNVYSVISGSRNGWINNGFVANVWHDYAHGLSVLTVILCLSFIASLFFTAQKKTNNS